MFGDNPILGVKTAKLDSKGRFFLPSFTCASNKDEIAISKNSDSYLKLFNLLQITKQIKELKSKILCEQDEIIVMQIENQLEILYASIIATTSVDSQRRLLIPKDIINANEYGECVTLQGGFDHLRVFDSRESFTEYQSRYIK